MKKIVVLSMLLVSFNVALSKSESCKQWFIENEIREVSDFFDDEKYLKNLQCFDELPNSIQEDIRTEYFRRKYPNAVYIDPKIDMDKEYDYKKIHSDLTLLASLCPKQDKASKISGVYVSHLPRGFLLEIVLFYKKEKERSLNSEVSMNIRKCIQVFKGGIDHSANDELYYSDFEFSAKNDLYVSLIEEIYEKIYLILYDSNMLTIEKGFPYPKTILREHIKTIDENFYQALENMDSSHIQAVELYFGNREKWLKSLNSYISKLIVDKAN
ncbi:hypothetical protein OXI21_07890 [Ignatzschineria sp. RMDPL8A]|uniref:hypothetical protein n=1 Tax=Ignatzschineria sp. RMDPL8A TaxID=2999236 RepID=UPI0024467892|nr:hypothetical protein [Ignatzschineria sp. RMDPL8A]MDG9730330.1 hypothetical protein [Ignatzschineria sp. RMDPL8A]